jgi:hypothetical protein
MLMVIGMGLLRVDAVQRRPTPPLHISAPDLSAHPFSSPPSSTPERVRKEEKIILKTVSRESASGEPMRW